MNKHTHKQTLLKTIPPSLHCRCTAGIGYCKPALKMFRLWREVTYTWWVTGRATLSLQANNRTVKFQKKLCCVLVYCIILASRYNMIMYLSQLSFFILLCCLFSCYRLCWWIKIIKGHSSWSLWRKYENFLSHIFVKRASIHVEPKPGWDPFHAEHFVQYNAAAKMHFFSM